MWDSYFLLKDLFFYLSDRVYSLFVKPPKVVGILDTLHYILENKCSVCRYGDGEMKFIMGGETWFQKTSPLLRSELTDLLHVNINNLIVCIPNKFDGMLQYTKEERKYWRKNISYTRRTWYKYIDKNKIYYDAFISRCYMPYNDKEVAKECFGLWKNIWKDRELLIVEGEKTRLGVGNTLFDNVKSIKRILCPNTQAFTFYNKLMDLVLEYDKEHLILIALGPTATIMAARLCEKGFQAIDIGHLDIEYEWFLMHAESKVPVFNKFVNEAGAGKGVGNCMDKVYQSEVIYKFNCE